MIKPPIPLYYLELSIRTFARYSLVLSANDQFHRAGGMALINGDTPTAPAPEQPLLRRRSRRRAL